MKTTTSAALFRRLATATGLSALAVLAATAIHTASTGAGMEVQAKGNGNAHASIAPTMQLGKTLGALPVTTTTTPSH